MVNVDIDDDIIFAFTFTISKISNSLSIILHIHQLLFQLKQDIIKIAVLDAALFGQLGVVLGVIVYCDR